MNRACSGVAIHGRPSEKVSHSATQPRISQPRVFSGSSQLPLSSVCHVGPIKLGGKYSCAFSRVGSSCSSSSSVSTGTWPLPLNQAGSGLLDPQLLPVCVQRRDGGGGLKFFGGLQLDPHAAAFALGNSEGGHALHDGGEHHRGWALVIFGQRIAQDAGRFVVGQLVVLAHPGAGQGAVPLLGPRRPVRVGRRDLERDALTLGERDAAFIFRFVAPSAFFAPLGHGSWHQKPFRSLGCGGPLMVPVWASSGSRPSALRFSWAARTSRPVLVRWWGLHNPWRLDRLWLSPDWMWSTSVASARQRMPSSTHSQRPSQRFRTTWRSLHQSAGRRDLRLEPSQAGRVSPFHLAQGPLPYQIRGGNAPARGA